MLHNVSGGSDLLSLVQIVFAVVWKSSMTHKYCYRFTLNVDTVKHLSCMYISKHLFGWLIQEARIRLSISANPNPAAHKLIVSHWYTKDSLVRRMLKIVARLHKPYLTPISKHWLWLSTKEVPETFLPVLVSVTYKNTLTIERTVDGWFNTTFSVYRWVLQKAHQCFDL